MNRMRDDLRIGPFVDRAVEERLVLTLYVAATAPNSRLAERNIRRLLTDTGADYSLEVVDCMNDPLRALRDGILVTPTLVKVRPHPQQTVIGTLGDSSLLASVLGLEVPAERSGTHD